MEQQEQNKSKTIKEDKKVYTENIKLKNYIKELEEQLKRLNDYLGGKL